MRLAVVTPEYAGVTAYTGGIGSQYAMLAPELVRQGHEVLVVTLGRGAAQAQEVEGVRLALIEQARLATLRPLGWARGANRALVKHEPFDVVLACEYAGGAWRYALRPHDSPLVTHLHSSTLQIARTSEWRRRERLLPVVLSQRVMERQQTRRSDALLAPTRSILRWSQELWRLPEIPARVVPNMIAVDRVRKLAEGERPADFPAGGPVIVYAGRLEARKGVHVLVRAMHDVWARLPDAQLVLLGADNPYRGGSMAEHLRELAGAHGARMHLLGPRPPEQLFPALRAADVVALPSLWENFATAALEAMAIGAPMVVTQGTGFDEFVNPGQEAEMVPLGDAGALGGALLRLLHDTELRQRLASAATATARGYDVVPVARRTAETLTELSARSV